MNKTSDLKHWWASVRVRHQVRCTRYPVRLYDDNRPHWRYRVAIYRGRSIYHR